jgi:hypothetical protein
MICLTYTENGDNAPNIVGKDIYVIIYTDDNGILPAGTHKTTAEINRNCSTTSTGEIAGFFCLLKVKENGWVIPDNIWNRK